MAIALVQNRQTWLTTSGTSVSLGYATDFAAGDFLWCAVAWNPSTVTATVSDSRNGAWTAVGSPQTGAGALANYRLQMFYRENSAAAAGNRTVTATFSASANPRGIVIAEFSGVATSASLDTSAYQSVNSNGITAPSITTTNANDVLIAAALAGVGIVSPYVGGGYTALATQWGSNHAAEYQVVSAAGAYTPNFVESQTQDNVVGIAAFKAPAAPSPTLRLLASTGVGT
jgi:hypothetical protein